MSASVQAAPPTAKSELLTPLKLTRLPANPPFKYTDVGAKIPNYIPSPKWGSQGQPHHTMQQPLAPQESMKRMAVPEGFHVELFAAEPNLGGKPLCMAWDERSRLWLAESVDYPNDLHTAEGGRDRIRICEDTDGDGRADRFTIFAEGLSIPSSIAFARGGLLVHSGGQTLLLKDTNGDDRADERRVLFTGWAMNDTHGGASNLQYGLDNWIWGMQGYNKSSVRIGDKTTAFAQGFHRFRPDGSAIEFLRSTNNNTWGLGLSEEGLAFGSTANGCPSVFMPIANRYYERVRGWTPSLTLDGIFDTDRISPITDKVRQVDHHGRYTAGAGHALYTARRYPERFWNRTAFVCEPTGHLVGFFALVEDGAGFRSANLGNFLASDDEWTAPTMAEVGPDGNVWVIDWYNYIVQHNPTPEGFQTGEGAAYETDLRDKVHARIYRVVYDKASDKANGKSAAKNLVKASPEELVATLTDDNLFWRRHAQRLLVERGKQDVVPHLIKLVADQSTDALGLNVGAIHALWTLHGLGALDGKHADALNAVRTALKHPSAGVRRNAVQVLPHGAETAQAILGARLLEDNNPQVRLQAMLTMADQPGDKSIAEAVVRFLQRQENAADRSLVDAATSAAAVNGEPLLLAAASTTSPSAPLRQVAGTAANHLARTAAPSTLASILKSLPAADPSIAGSIINGLQAGWPASAALKLDADVQHALEKLQPRLALEDQVHLARLAVRLGSTQLGSLADNLAKTLLAQVEDSNLPLRTRARAAELAVSVKPNDAGLAGQVLDLITPQSAPEFNLSLLRALQASAAPGLGGRVLERTATLPPATRDAAIDLLLSRAALTAAVLDALQNGGLRSRDLSLMQRQRLERHPDEAIRRRAKELLAKTGDVPSANRQQVLADYASVVKAPGDAARGKLVFTKNCAVCHRYRGEGASLGPDLTGMAVHGKEHLLQNILDPNRDVEANFQAYVVQTADGQVITGMLASESATAIEIVDAQSKRHAILREDLEQLSRSGVSFMPEGFEKQLTRENLADLLEFLGQRSRFVPLDLRRVGTVSSARGMFTSPDAKHERMLLEDWNVKTVEGVPFYPIDPQGGRVANVVLLYSSRGTIPPTMPRSVTLDYGAPAKAIHVLGGVAGWGFPATKAGTTSMIVRLHYADGKTEDHPLINGVHVADYLGHQDVEKSKPALDVGQQQLRYLKIGPKRSDPIAAIELIKGDDETAPLVMAITVEQP